MGWFLKNLYYSRYRCHNTDMKTRRKIGSLQKKILLLLLAGFALGLTYSPRRQFRIINEASDEWKKINQQSLRKAITMLYHSKIVKTRVHGNGTTAILLSQKGKRLAGTYNLEQMRLPSPKRWDGKWRMVLSDIPEKKKNIREEFRYHLKRLGFQEFQKSVYVYPFECRNELDVIVEWYRIKPLVRYAVIEYIDNDMQLRREFSLGS